MLTALIFPVKPDKESFFIDTAACAPSPSGGGTKNPPLYIYQRGGAMWVKIGPAGEE
jgi:hypothetical protein